MSGTDYDAFARRVVADGVILDPWLDGAPRLSAEPLVLSAAEHAMLLRVGDDVAALYDEAVQLVHEDEALLEGFFGLTPVQRLMWTAERPRWHGIARADVFLTADGPVITELNCDTPTGEAEATVLNRLALADRPGLLDPNAELPRRFVDMLEAVIARLVDGPAPRTVGIVYPTEFTEDLSVIRLYRSWLEARGLQVVLGSPYNLGAEPGDEAAARATLFGRPLAAILRHYKTDAWGERASVWDDEALPDPLPLAAPLAHALRASALRRTAIVNPFGAVVPQNKRAMAFMWEHIHRFGIRAQGLIERHVPYTSRLETLHAERVLADREGWVLKSDYGAEGEEVVIGRETDDATWAATVAHARRGRWIAQRWFEAVADPRPAAAGVAINWGVFVVAGEACGVYARRQPGATDDAAVSVPVLVDAAR